MRLRATTVALLAPIVMASASMAQSNRPSSPSGTAATQVAGGYKEQDGRQRYSGKWIEVTYNRPILRGREQIFGSGESYGERVNGGAPVWRAGANQSTRLKTEVGLMFGDQKLPAGEYSVFVDLKEGGWTLILSSHKAQQSYDPNDKEAIWGSYGYKEELDVLRMPMEVKSGEHSVDQFTIGFVDMTQEGGKLTMWWEKTVALAPFSVAN